MPLNSFDATGNLVKLLSGWPQESLAQVYSTVTPMHNKLVGRDYLFAGKDRRCGYFFEHVKRSALASSVRLAEPDVASRERKFTRMVAAIGGKLMWAGLWELIFVPRLSPSFKSWLRSFSPEVIYFVGSGLTYMQLCLDIQEYVGVPICLHIQDDWIDTLYARSGFRWLLQPRMNRAFQTMLQRSCARFVIGTAMQKEYEARYGVSFDVLGNIDDSFRYTTAAPERLSETGVLSIVYSGAIGDGRWRLLVDMAQACQFLAVRGTAAKLHVFTNHPPAEAVAALRNNEFVQLHQGVPNDRVPGVLTGADVLFLPESFDEDRRAYLKFSVSTKAHLYMMAQRPIVVNGARGSGVVEYAREGQWGIVIDGRSPAALADALVKIASNDVLIQQTLANGRRIAAEHHEGDVQRKRFHRSLVGKLAV